MIKLHQESRIVRPPFEARSVYLQVTNGCTHNKCKFCTYYGDVDYRVSQDDEIIENLKELKNRGYVFKRIWLLSADPFSLNSEQLLKIASYIHEYLPFVESIGCYARITSLNNKTVHDLEKLKENGYDKIVFGVESADDNILEYTDKGYRSHDITIQLKKMDKAGMNYTVIFLNGLSGHNYGLEHARKTAELFNKLNPERIMINTLKIHEKSILENEVERRLFEESTDKEKMDELIEFIEKLEINTFLDATNDTNKIKFFGKIQEKKKDIVEFLQKSNY